MDRIKVQSQAIVSAGWSKGTLELEMPNGNVYAYAGVPEQTFKAMLEAASVGKYYHANIKRYYIETSVGKG